MERDEYIYKKYKIENFIRILFYFLREGLCRNNRIWKLKIFEGLGLGRNYGLFYFIILYNEQIN